MYYITAKKHYSCPKKVNGRIQFEKGTYTVYFQGFVFGMPVFGNKQEAKMLSLKELKEVTRKIHPNRKYSVLYIESN